MFKVGLMRKEFLLAKPEYIEFFVHADGHVTSACFGGEWFQDNESAEKVIKIIETYIKGGDVYQSLWPYSCVKVDENRTITTLAVVW